MSRLYVLAYLDGDPGDGPILSASDFKYTQRLSLLGDWSFRVPLSDAKAAARLRPFETHIEVSIEIDGIFTPLVAGRVESIQRTAPDQVTISGYDLLRELTYRRIPDYLLAVDTQITPTVMVENGGVFTILNDGDSFNLGAAGAFLYVGYTQPFDIIQFTFNVPNTRPGATNWGFSPFWEEPGVTDETILGGVSLGQNGDIIFVRPGSWEPTTVNGVTLYWLRLDPEEDFSETHLNQVRAIIREPDPDDLDTLLSVYAPAWILSCYSSTGSPRVVRFYGETLFEAIGLLANREGEHFRLGPHPFIRNLCYLRDDLDAPEIQLMAVNYPVVDNDPGYAYIRQIKNDERMDGLITRLYVFGAGVGFARQSLRNLSVPVPPGYVVDQVHSYIEHTASVAAYGVIEGILELPDMGDGAGGSSTSPEISDALFRAGKAYLDKHIVQYVNYQFEVVDLKKRLVPGNQIHLVWDRYDTEGNSVWSFNSHQDGPLVILEVQTALSGEGLVTTTLTTAEIIRYPETDQRLLTDVLHKLELARRHPQPILERQVRTEDYTDL